METKLNEGRRERLKQDYFSRVAAFTPVMSRLGGDHIWHLGMAVANERGYIPVPESWAYIKQGLKAYDIISDYCDTLNEVLFNLDPDVAIRIVCSTMAAQNREKEN